ncbi:hypothetical protein [Micromonospora tarensis]|uniref:S-adenosyl methyltransferase n=1 Tax=Micromonospora tarensis TaxID=2806100 RepID=A0ABS1Y9W1_9ACTN|nr:hypothetical protein [Micromonospora tarensis]MBM0274124.1 hypothetical protein [Micromonospora tarensis]
MGDHVVLVNATDHPDPDEWVIEHAQDEADRAGLTLGEYLGREDTLGAYQTLGMCCHVFAASKPSTVG